ncbi:MAG: recombinase family protein [Oscillospiraceae bacterium]|nr:recombinase family protein [Oscillospiraceae bacterium]
MRTGIYVRVSTEEQAQEGYSIRAQQEKLADYARLKDWSVYKVYCDEGISGKNVTERPAVNEMIDDIEKGRINNVLIFKIDRLTRSITDLVNFIELFNEYDCCFNSFSENIDTHTATGRMFIKFMGIIAEFERENISERSKLGFERKVKEGYTLATRTASYGYDRTPGNKVQQINKYEAQIVLEVFDMFVNKNMAYLEIAQNLNERNIKTKEKGKWHSRSIKNMLTNCNHVGNVRYATKDEKRNFEVEGVHEAIVSKELYEETQDLIEKIAVKSYTKRPKEEHYYSGVLICDKCEGKLVTHGDYKVLENGERVIKGGYRCSNYLRKTCNASNVSHKNADLAFSAYINDIPDFNAIDDVQIQEKENEQKRAIEAIAELNKKLDKFEEREKEILNLYIAHTINFEKYNKMQNSINDEKEHILVELERLENTESEDVEVAKKDIIKNLKENWDLLDKLQRRQFLIKCVDNIRIVNEVPEGKKKGITTVTDIQFNNPLERSKRKSIKTALLR